MMAEDPVKCIPLEETEDIDEDAESCNEDSIRCVKLCLPEHISAYLEKRDLIRDVEEITCEKSLIENITSNYVIVKKIISNLSWQDKLLCKHVCSMWHSVVHTLQNEQVGPLDFVISLKHNHIRNGVKLIKSDDFYTEPLVVFVFANYTCSVLSHKCEMWVPSPCEPACEKEHYIIDVVKHHVAAPKNCMLTVKGCYTTFCSVPQSKTFEYKVTRQSFRTPLISGIFIPKLPNVEFTVINITDVLNLKAKFYDVVDKVARDQIIKGVIIYVNESYLLHSVEDIVFLNYFKEVQPNVPYALGGCIVEDTIVEQSDIDSLINGINTGRDYVSENLITIGIFSVPKIVDNMQDNSNFDMYSLVMDSSAWAKAKIQSTINEFAKKVPHYEHSVVLKLSCVGRDQKHDCERDYFRAAFPNTRIIGCYGNGELGVNHPTYLKPEEPLSAKRHRRDPGPQFGIMYSYSTVFVYIGWGKVILQPEGN